MRKCRRPDGRVFDRPEYERQRVECFNSGVLVNGKCGRFLEESGCDICRPLMCSLIQNVRLSEDPFKA